MPFDQTANNSKLQQAQEAFNESARILEERLSDKDFLANKGLGNEVGIHIYCYDPTFELQARKLFQLLSQKSQQGSLPCNIIVRNLYDMLIDICEEKRILQAVPKQEEKRGAEAQIKQLQKVATPELFAKKLEYENHQPGDVLLITGVGQVYPVLRAHVLLDNLQHLFEDIPVILAYPGDYDGQSFALFKSVNSPGQKDGNYYRAFDLV